MAGVAYLVNMMLTTLLPLPRIALRALMCVVLATTSGVALLAQSRSSGTVSGQVVTADHRPLARARVELATSRSTRLSVLTDTSGRFVFRGVPADRYTVAASLPGYLPATEASKGMVVQVGDGQVVRDIEIHLVRGGVLAGLVTDPAGAPVVSGTVRIMRQLSDHGGFGQGVTTHTDNRGAFRMWGIPAGTYVVSATATSPTDRRSGVDVSETLYPGTTSAADALAITLKAGDEVGGIDFSLTSVPPREGTSAIRGVITGVVYTDAGSPAAGMRVEARKEGRGAESGSSRAAATARTNDRGEFRLWGLLPGPYYLSAAPATSTPVDGVGAAGQDNAAGGFEYVRTFYPGTDSPNRAEPIMLPPEEELNGVSFPLRLMFTTTVKGVVLDRSGTPPASAIINVVEQASDPTKPVKTFRTRSYPSGAFEITGIPAGQYTIDAVADGARPLYVSTPLSVAQTAIPELKLVLNDSGKISGKIRWESDSGRRFNPEAIAISARRFGMTLSGRLSNASIAANGSFAFTDVLPGKYAIRAANIPSGWYLRAVSVEGLEITDGVLDVPSSGTLKEVRVVFGERPQ